MSKGLITKSFFYDGKRYYVRGKTEKDAIMKMANRMRDLEEGKIALNGNMTVKAWTNQCIQTYKTKQKDITRKKYIQRVNHCILEHIGDMQLKKVKPLHCQQVINLQMGNSKAQINEVYQALNFIFSHAVDNQLIISNPAEKIVKPAGTKTYRRAITENEREHIIKVAKTDRRFNLYLLMLYCGCRPSEAAECMGKDIKIIEGFPILHIRGTKTANSDRKVPIDEAFFNLVKDIPKNEYIAQYITGSKIEIEHRNRLWKSFKRQLNISMGCKMYRNQLQPPYPVAPDLVPYCLRHTYCTDLARNGVDIRIAQKLMGHSTITLTANIYTHVDNDDLISVAKKLKENKESVAPTVAPTYINV